MVEVLLRLDIKFPLSCFSRSQPYVGQTHTLLQLHNTFHTIYFPAGFGDNIHWRTLDDGKKEAEARWADAGKICTETMWDQHGNKKNQLFIYKQFVLSICLWCGFSQWAAYHGHHPQNVVRSL